MRKPRKVSNPIAVLEALRDGGGETGVDALARSVGLPRDQVRQICATHAAWGYVDFLLKTSTRVVLTGKGRARLEAAP